MTEFVYSKLRAPKLYNVLLFLSGLLSSYLDSEHEIKPTSKKALREGVSLSLHVFGKSK